MNSAKQSLRHEIASACCARLAMTANSEEKSDAAEVTPVSEIAQWRFTPGAISKQLMDDYSAEVLPKGKAAAA